VKPERLLLGTKAATIPDEFHALLSQFQATTVERGDIIERIDGV
jgi:hypothetical protein